MDTTLMAITLMTAVISGFVGFGFWSIEKKLGKLETENEHHHRESITMRTAEREVLLSVADTTILMAKKINDKNSVNGELEASVKELQEKKDHVQALTREIAYEYLERKQKWIRNASDN